jgi:hypothetical protein
MEADAASGVIDDGCTHVGPGEEATWERDESAALQEAALDLVRLDRYERRARSQQKRAIIAFMDIKLMKGIAATKGDSPSPAAAPPAAR